MKKLMLGLLALTSISALAHPGDSKSLSLVDVGSTIEFLVDINIPSDNKTLAQEGALYAYYGDIDGHKPFCNFAQRNSSSQTRDVVIKAGRTLKVVSNSISIWGDDTVSLQLSTNNSDVFVEIACAKALDTRNGDFYGNITIGQFKKLTEGLVKLNLAAPQEL